MRRLSFHDPCFKLSEYLEYLEILDDGVEVRYRKIRDEMIDILNTEPEGEYREVLLDQSITNDMITQSFNEIAYTGLIIMANSTIENFYDAYINFVLDLKLNTKGINIKYNDQLIRQYIESSDHPNKVLILKLINTCIVHHRKIRNSLTHNNGIIYYSDLGKSTQKYINQDQVSFNVNGNIIIVKRPYMEKLINDMSELARLLLYVEGKLYGEDNL